RAYRHRPRKAGHGHRGRGVKPGAISKLTKEYEQQFNDGFIFIRKQGLVALFGLSVIFAIMKIPMQVIERMAMPLLGCAIVLLALIFIPGVYTSGGGAERWISFGGFRFQTSECAKLALVFFLAKNLSRRGFNIHDLRAGILPNLMIFGLLAVFMMKQPDFGRLRQWLAALVEIAHRKFHLLPADMEPGLQEKFVWEVPTGGQLPTSDGRVQMYPCHSFESHLVLLSIDPDTCKVTLRRYVCGHDCGVMISPDVVHGMTYGGIAHGLGAALMEKFSYSEEGQLLAGTFMDYLLPSAHEVPSITIVDHCTPSPLTEFGQKGSGEAGYLGSPAAIASAVNDALQPRGASIDA
ncbi:MAG: hypothetical protein EBS53_19225, partial [Bacteroidetes bacterium]|nr:hypothetical protein [Bacteroidota bacterium]